MTWGDSSCDWRETLPGNTTVFKGTRLRFKAWLKKIQNIHGNFLSFFVSAKEQQLLKSVKVLLPLQNIEQDYWVKFLPDTGQKSSILKNFAEIHCYFCKVHCIRDTDVL